MPAVSEAKQKMEDGLEAVRREFATVRTGKATPALLDTVKVEAYGARMPLNQVATVSSPEPSLLVVQPFDRSLIAEVEKGIRVADLGFNPANDGAVIRIPVPPLNEERRKEFVRLLNKMAEEARISIRHARRDANDQIKALARDGEIGEDERQRRIDEVQRLTDEYTSRIDQLLETKEQEVLAL